MDLPVNPDYPYYLSESDLMELSGHWQAPEPTEWERFLGYAEQGHIAAGGTLIRQFDTDRALYLLTSGTLEVWVAEHSGGPVATIEPYAVLGEQSFLEPGPRSATVIAKTDAILHRLTPGAFDLLRVEAPAMACALLFDIARTLSRRARTRDGRTNA
ncbi:MAG: cyclic nucleotide-binding domain-containing protein [Planctomycetes bacterium]|nr:cyclic nucleotide-binding domain-containing protein [Planctomycetota bacterium]